ncbi:MAG: hypothetical protein ACK4WD_00530 [Flavobacteriales bacterium]
MTKILSLILFVIITISSSAQSLNPQDSIYLARFHRELITTTDQKPKIDSIYFSYASKIALIESEMKAIQQSSLNEEEINTKVTALNEEKKMQRQLRELDLTAILTDEQKKIFNEKIKPSKPAVLHFGMTHDRMNCGVCK